MDLPRTKTDVKRAVALVGAPVATLEEHIPELLTWLKDWNWPVARPVAAALAKCGRPLVEPVQNALRSDDAIWKFWILSCLLCDVAPSVRVAVADDVLNLANNPTTEDRQEEVEKAAMDVLILINHNDT